MQNVSLPFRKHTVKVWPENRLTPRIIPADLPQSLHAVLLDDQQSITVNETQTHQRELYNQSPNS